MDGLYFSSNGVSDGSYNESMSVADDGYTLLFQPLGMAHFGQHDGSALTTEGVAKISEVFDDFVGVLQPIVIAVIFEYSIPYG